MAENDLEHPVATSDEGTVGIERESRGAFGALAGEERARLGRFAGVLMMVGALVSLPAGFTLEPAPEPYEHLIGIASGLVGLVALLAPWERMSSNWLHVAMIVATVEIAIGVAVLSDDYAFFYVLVAMFAAYVIREPQVMLAYILFLTLALVAPLTYADETLKEQAHHILVTLPILVIAAAIVRYLRDTLEQREREYRGFAFEAVSLAERIRGGEDLGPEPQGDLKSRLGKLADEHEVAARR